MRDKHARMFGRIFLPESLYTNTPRYSKLVHVTTRVRNLHHNDEEKMQLATVVARCAVLPVGRRQAPHNRAISG